MFYAAVTGVVLWLASMVGGWFDNLSVYNRIPQAIEEHRFGDLIGRRRMKWLAGKFSHEAGGWATSIALGFMLGFTPAFGHFFGIPLDVRHVTLSTGTLALASASLDRNWFNGGWLLLGAAGIATMFVLNLSVSFLLSLFNAAYAYGFTPKQVRALLRRLLQRFLHSPLDFFLPPRKASR